MNDIAYNKNTTIKSEAIPYVEYKGKKMLIDVVIIRLALIFLLVWTHTFTPFIGGWDVIPGYEDIHYPKWVIGVISACRMPGLVFVSGYLLGYVAKRKADALSFKSAIIKKINRLLLPSIVFSVFYSICFYDFGDLSVQLIVKSLTGAGHLWFLPMLFWCFSLLWALEHFKVGEIAMCLFAVAATIIPFKPMILEFDRTAHFFIFFFLGYSLQKGYFRIEPLKYGRTSVIALFLLYISVFLFDYNFSLSDILIETIKKSSWIPDLIAGNDNIVKMLAYMAGNSETLVLQVSGVLLIYFTAHVVIIPNFKIPSFLIMLSSYCYGVYIFHQFILKGIYYHTSMIHYIPDNLIVWVVMPMTIVLSLMMTHLALKTKLGRKYIG